MTFNLRRSQANFAPQADLRRPALGLADVAVGLGVLALLYLVAHVGSESLVRFAPPDIIPSISLDPRNLPNYAARSTLRMFIALAASTIFTFIYGYAAARSSRAERVLIPLLDILQSIPVLGFLSVTVTAFIALGVGEVGHAALLGLTTGARVVALLVFSTCVWTPIAVAIGFSPKVARVSQPVAQILASFPANFLFPFATLGFISAGISLNWGSMLLMAAHGELPILPECEGF